jgi:hypothetical protein
VGTGQREHHNLQRGAAHADVFSLSRPNVEYSGTAVFASDCPWQVKTELWLLEVFITFSMTYDRPALQISMGWAIHPEFRSLQFPVQISDRGNHRSPSAPEVAPLKYPSNNYAYTSGTRFLSVDLGQHGKRRQSVRSPDQIHLTEKY